MTSDAGSPIPTLNHSVATTGMKDGPRRWQVGAIFALGSAILFLLSTRHGIGILPDSTRYMGLVSNPYDAPMYAWIIRGIAATGVPIELGAKVFGLLVVCANSYFLWSILARATANQLLAGFGTAIIIFSPHFVGIHSLAMSEPLFIFCILIVLMALIKFLETEKQIWLIGCGIAIGITSLVRFTGVPLGAAVASFLLLRSGRRLLAQRFVEAGIVGLFSGAIFSAWAFAAKMGSGQAIGRDLAFHGNLNAKQWVGGLNTLSAMLMPAQIPLVLRIAVLFLVIAGCAYLCSGFVRRNRRLQGRKELEMLAIVLGLFFVFYVAFVALSALIEANLFLTGRYGFPAYVTLVMLLTIVLTDAGLNNGSLKYFRWMFFGLAALIFSMHIVRTVDRTRDDYAKGIGYASLAWTNSPTMQSLKKLPPEALIFSNGEDAVAYVLRRKSYFVPVHVNSRTGFADPNNPFEKQVEDLRRKLLSEPGFVVFFDNIDWRFYMVAEEELKRLLNLKLIDKQADGRIYALQENE
jgi:4-amino-4-deoxy-L-arabinose transferase-like glycosyltransferase